MEIVYQAGWLLSESEVGKIEPSLDNAELGRFTSYWMAKVESSRGSKQLSWLASRSFQSWTDGIWESYCRFAALWDDKNESPLGDAIAFLWDGNLRP